MRWRIKLWHNSFMFDESNFPWNAHPTHELHTATHCNTLQHTATRCNTLQHTATHCNTLQHTATHWTTPIQHMSYSASVWFLIYKCAKSENIRNISHRGTPGPAWMCYGVALVSRIDKIIGLFFKGTYKRDDILQKRPVILSILLTIATPYAWHNCTLHERDIW